MKEFTEQILSAIQEVQKELLEIEELILPDSIEQVNINQLVRPDYSRRIVIPNLIKVLVKSLTEFDFVGGIIVNSKNNHVIDGWHRVEIWKTMGNVNIPCYILDVNSNQERKLHLLLNRQVSQFQASDFGFTSVFADLDLVKDYGFTRADFFDEANSDEPIVSKEQSNKLIKKLITALPESYHQKLEGFKKGMPAPNKSQVLIKLIDFYEKNRG